MKLILSLVTLFSCVTAFAVEDLPKFDVVSEGIYRGGRPTDVGLEMLKGMSLKTMVNLQGGDIQNLGLGTFFTWWEPGETVEARAHEQEIVEGFGAQFINVPINSLAPGWTFDDKGIDRILEVMNDPNQRPVYVHCEHGIDRSGMIIALHRVKNEKWSVHEAFTEWYNSGHTNTHLMLQNGLDWYFFQKVKTFQNEK